MLTKSQKLANEQHFNFAINNIKDGGFYFWQNKQEALIVKDNKFNLTNIQFSYISEIVSKKWLKNNVLIIPN
tara:strand:+ start:191 stop:406 length:216 start_codon:yes stop_codon:yes gene_type:complete